MIFELTKPEGILMHNHKISSNVTVLRYINNIKKAPSVLAKKIRYIDLSLKVS